MMIIIGSAQVAVSNVCVDLSRRDIAMAKKCLNGARVGAMLQQVSGKTVTHSMRRNMLKTNLGCVISYHGPGKLSRQRSAAVQEQLRKR